MPFGNNLRATTDFVRPGRNGQKSLAILPSSVASVSGQVQGNSRTYVWVLTILADKPDGGWMLLLLQWIWISGVGSDRRCPFVTVVDAERPDSGREHRDR